MSVQQLIPREKRRRGPPLKKPHLNTIDAVAVEMARVYRQARAGEIPLQDATRLSFILAQLGKLMETALIERRIDALEADEQV